jgi:hypothetical protein
LQQQSSSVRQKEAYFAARRVFLAAIPSHTATSIALEPGDRIDNHRSANNSANHSANHSASVLSLIQPEPSPLLSSVAAVSSVLAPTLPSNGYTPVLSTAHRARKR